MKSFRKLILFGLALSLAVSGYANQKKETHKMPDAMELERMIRRFAPTEVAADASKLSANDRKALDKIIQAARLMDPIFLRQAWSGNVRLMKKLEADRTPLGRERLHYFMINKGPWSRLDENEPFLPGVPEVKPAYGGFYPDDITKEEFNNWVKTLSDEERKRA